jgi:hypothetical protein
MMNDVFADFAGRMRQDRLFTRPSEWFTRQLELLEQKKNNEVRSLIKAITLLSIDLTPDYDNNKFNIYQYPHANNRSKKGYR